MAIIDLNTNVCKGETANRLDREFQRLENLISQISTNEQLLQANIEHELLLQELNNDIVKAELFTYLSAPWYIKINKKKRAKLLLEAEEDVMERYKPKICQAVDKMVELAKKQIMERNNE